MTLKSCCFHFRTKSKEKLLSKCRLYRVEMLMVYGGKYNASMGIMLPNGTFEEPIGKDRLFWVRPGKVVLKRFYKAKMLKVNTTTLVPSSRSHGSEKNCTLVVYLTFLSFMKCTSFRCICSGTNFYFEFFE